MESVRVGKCQTNSDLPFLNKFILVSFRNYTCPAKMHIAAESTIETFQADQPGLPASFVSTNSSCLYIIQLYYDLAA